MGQQLEERVDVEIAPDGEPRSFVWARFVYEVIGQPQSFFERRDWWRERGVDLVSIDRERWRVFATADGDHVERYDLRRDGDGSWLLAVAWDR